MVVLAPTAAPSAPRGTNRSSRKKLVRPSSSPPAVAVGEPASEPPGKPPRAASRIGLTPGGPVPVSVARLLGGAVILFAVGIGVGTWRSTQQSGTGVAVREVPLTRSAVLSQSAGTPARNADPAAGPPPTTATRAQMPIPTTTPGAGTQVVVHAAGAVAHPGVYVLSAGARAADAVHAAGGMTPDADPDRVNLATMLTDGNRLYIPRKGATVPAVPAEQLTGAPPQLAPSVGGSPGSPSRPIDLNSATTQQLDGLPGVGPATAAAIIEHRTKIGRFKSVNQLLDVPGIGEAKLASIRKQLVVG